MTPTPPNKATYLDALRELAQRTRTSERERVNLAKHIVLLEGRRKATALAAYQAGASIREIARACPGAGSALGEILHDQAREALAADQLVPSSDE